MSPADVLPDCSTLLFTRLATLDGTPGGTRTPNLRFWRPLLCQLSYWRIFELCRSRKRQWRLAPPLPVPAISGERGSGDSLRGGDPGSLAAPGMMFRQPCAQGAHGPSHHLTIFATTPAPTVRPPSRIAKRRPSSIAIGLISATTIFTLSPGITISTPSGSWQAPVMSVVRK